MAMTMLVQLQTARFGAVETVMVPQSALFTFPEGVPGFEEYTAFALIEDADYAPFGWLQSLAEPALKFIVVDPQVVVPDYAVDLAEGDVGSLALAHPGEARLLAIVSVPGSIEAMTANLKAPVVLNCVRRLGKQVILNDDRYSLREPVLTGDEAAGEGQPAC